MAQSIRISDELYARAQMAGAVAERSLAQQLEYWARMGAAIDAAGITSQQVADLLRMGRLDALVALVAGKADNEGASSSLIRRRRDALGAQVRAGERGAESLLAFTADDVARSKRTFAPYTPAELEGEGGW